MLTLRFVAAASVLVGSVIGSSTGLAASPQPGPLALADRIGCTHAKGAYHFTDKDFLREGADVILETGMRTIKLYLHDPHVQYRFNSDWPKRFRDLVAMASHPYYGAVFDMPFRTYILNAFSVTDDEPMKRWRENDYTAEEQAEDVRQFRDLTAYLMKTYKGTGKTFILQTWEGDWAVRGVFSPDENADPGDEVIARMIRWLNARQEGVDQGRQAAGRSDVKVYHAAEVNLVALAMQGRPTVTNNVLPHTRCDLYSYSAYDVLAEISKDPVAGRVKLIEALNYLAAKAPDNRAFGNRNIYLGEYGWPEVQNPRTDPHATPETSLMVIRTATETALQWGCPYVVYWQVYCNEAHVKDRRPTNSEVRGFYLIKPDGTPAPAYHYFTSLLRETK